MIWQLAREQFRSQKRYVAWTGALLALTVAVATFGSLTVTTQIHSDQIAQVATGTDRPWHLSVPESSLEGDSTLVETDLAVHTAVANGSDVIASREFELMPQFDGLFVDPFVVANYTAVALSGDVDWDQLLVSGAAPSTGQAVITAEYAHEHGLEIRDDVDLVEPWSGSSVALPTLSVSGFSRSQVNSGAIRSWVPTAYVAWEDTESLSEFWFSGYTELAWSIDDTAIEGLVSPDTGEPFYSEGTGGIGASSTVGGYTLLIGIAMLLGLFAMSFAVGRSQAQVRLRWVATARTLGANRRTIAAATVAETLLVGAIASVIGFALGYSAMVLTLAATRSTVASPALPEHVSVPWYIVVGTVVFGLLLAAIIGAIPAFWASRVSPVAALKPINDVTEAEVSRRISSTTVLVSWVIAAGILAALRWIDPQDSLLVGAQVLLVIAVVALGIALLIDLLRTLMSALGRALSRTGKPWAIAAGDALSARPRQAAIPAFIMASLIAGLLIATASTYVSSSLQNSSYVHPDDYSWFAYVPADSDPGSFNVVVVGLLGLLVVALTTFAIAGSAQRAVGADAATREALGLTPAAARFAAGIQYSLPLAIGAMVGWLVSAFIYAWFVPGFTANWDADPVSAGDVALAIASTTIPVICVLASGLITAALVGTTIGLTTRTGTPVKQMQHTS